MGTREGLASFPSMVADRRTFPALVMVVLAIHSAALSVWAQQDSSTEANSPELSAWVERPLSSKVLGPQSEGGLYWHRARQHAPLAAFSLGSMVMTGLFYTLAKNDPASGAHLVNASPSDWDKAIWGAGITSLLAAGSYLYYVYRPQKRYPWNPSVALGLDRRGAPSIRTGVDF